MEITRSQKEKLDDFVGIITSMLTVVGAFPAMGGVGAATNLTAAGFELFYIALKRMGAFKIDKIKSLQSEYEEVIRKSLDCAQKKFTAQSTQKLFEEVNLKISYQIKKNQLDCNSSFDDIYNALKEAANEYFRSEQESPCGRDIKDFFDTIWDCFDLELSDKPQLSGYIQIKELREIKSQVQTHEEWLKSHDKEIEKTNERIDRSAFIRHEIVFKEPGLPVKEYVALEGIISEIDKKNAMGRPLLICSPGGIGKSELCRKYYAEKKLESKFVWFNFTDSITATLLTVADQSKVSDPFIRNMEINRVKDELRALGKTATIIIDNVISMKSEDVDLLSNVGCKVIITSREKYEALKGNLEKLELDYLTISLCREVFKKYSNKAVLKNEKDELDKVISLAGRHTLAIQLLAKIYAESPKYENLEALLAELKEKAFELPELVTQNRDKVYRRFMEHFVKLFDISCVLIDADKMHILKNMSIIGGIPTPREKLLEWIGNGYQDSYKELVGSSWISENNYMADMHDLIIESISAQTPPQFSDIEVMVEKMINEMQFDPKDIMQYNPPYFIQYEIVGQYLLDKKEENEKIASFYHALAQMHYNKGQYAQALKYYKSELTQRENGWGKESVEIANNYCELGIVYRDIGDLPRAVKHLNLAFSVLNSKNVGSDLEFAKVYHNLGGVYKDLNKLPKSLRYYKKALRIRKRELGEESLDTTTTYNDIAGLLFKKGKLEEALKYFEKLRLIREKICGKEHPFTAIIYNNLAIVYRNEEKYDEALYYFLKALDIRKAVFGEKHPDTATIYNNIAWVYQNIEDKDNACALDYLIKALRIRRKVFGIEHQNTAITYNNIARYYYSTGILKKALKYHKKAIAIREKILPEGHLDLGSSYYNIAEVYYDLGNKAKAIENYESALRISKKILGKKHVKTVSIIKKINLINIGVRKQR